MKTCTACGQIKNVFEFYYFKAGVYPVCKTCHRQRARDVRAKASPEERAKKRAAHKIWSDADKKKNPEKYRAKYTQDRLRNPEGFRRRQREYRARNRDLAMFRSAKERAKVRGWEFSITREWLRQRLDVGVCEATGLRFNSGEFKGVGKADPFSASLDRKDSAKGYTSENCRLVLWGFNMALSQWGQDIYAEIAQAYLVKNLSKIN